VAVVSSYFETVQDPLKQLQRFLSNPAFSEAHSEEKIDFIYTQILKKCNWNDSDFVNDYQLIIEAVIAAKSPMSKNTLQQLHENALSNPISVLLAPLSSLLPGIQHVKQPLQILHQLLHDFLTMQTLATNKFHLNEMEYSANLHLCVLIWLTEHFCYRTASCLISSHLINHASPILSNELSNTSVWLLWNSSLFNLLHFIIVWSCRHYYNV